MAFLGADTDELREVGQEFQEGKEVTDQVITYLRALIAILRAASFFSGGASLAYAQYLESTVVPWLEKISQALGLFATVLNSQAQAQDEASEGGSVDYGSLPSYSSPALPAPITPFEGGSIVGGATAPVASPPASGSGAPGGGSPLGGATVTPPSLTIGDNGHLMIDTGIDLDGPDGAGATTPPSTTTPGAPLGAGRLDTLAMGSVEAAPLSGGAGGGGLGAASLDGSGGTGGLAGGGAGGMLGGGSVSTPLGGGSIGGGIGGDAASGTPTAEPFTRSTPIADGGLGGATPGSESLAGTPMSTASEAVAGTKDGPSYGAAAGIAGGAAALGLGGAALAAKAGGPGGGGSNAAIDKLAAGNGRGSRGDEVKALQEKLTAAGYDTKGADGAWGRNTQAAYDAYRTEHPLPIQAGQGYTSPAGYDYTKITGVRGNANVTPEFLRSVEAMSQRLGARPEHIMAAMSFETGGTFASDVKNPRSSATGLIQFMDATAKGLGTTTSELARMTPTEQLPYVEKYFEPHRGRLGDLESVYTSILAGHPASGNEALFTEGQKAYGPNRELDVDRNGVITAAEATAHVRSRMGSGGH